MRTKADLNRINGFGRVLKFLVLLPGCAFGQDFPNKHINVYNTSPAIGRKREDEMDREIVNGLFEAELNYRHQHEWARTADDVLWRHTRLGMLLNAAQRDTVAAWCGAHWMSKETACS